MKKIDSNHSWVWKCLLSGRRNYQQQPRIFSCAEASTRNIPWISQDPPGQLKVHNCITFDEIHLLSQVFTSIHISHPLGSQMGAMGSWGSGARDLASGMPWGPMPLPRDPKGQGGFDDPNKPHMHPCGIPG